MTYQQLQRLTAATLAPWLGQGEALATASLIMEEVTGMDRVKLLMHHDQQASPFMVGKVEAVAGRVARGEPVQYVLGRARWRGMDLEVNPSVLIPRPETARLVDMIVGDMGSRKDLRVLDLGTGSGAIAIALARSLPFPKVTAVDISPDALATARRNAKSLRAGVDFRQADILDLPAASGAYDVVVSNPPYVLQREAAGMDTRVKDHEPASALFVPDSDPLRFYRPITRHAHRSLTPGGRLYYEINPLAAKDLLVDTRRYFPDAEILKDIHGTDRYLAATKKGLKRNGKELGSSQDFS